MKTPTTHTPGPWKMGSNWQNIWAQGRLVAEVTPGNCEPGELKANARLIAAAPELLRSVEDLTNRFECCLIYSGTDPKMAKIAVKQWRDLITKAEKVEG